MTYPAHAPTFCSSTPRGRGFRPAWVLPLFLLVLSAPPAAAQGTKADYDRGASLPERVRGKVRNARLEPHWIDGGKTFWYRHETTADEHEFLLVDAERATKQPAFDHEKLAAALSTRLSKEYLARRLPLEQLAFVDGGAALQFGCDGRGWKFVLAAGELAEVPLPPEPPRDSNRPRRGRRREAMQPTSPDGQWQAVISDHNVRLRPAAGGDEQALSTDGTPEHYYESRFHWSPDSRKLVVFRTLRGDDRKVHLIESSPQEELQPKLQSYDYLKPGDRIPLTKPVLFDVAERKVIPIRDELFPNPWETDQLHWSPDSQRFLFRYNQRGHQVLRIVAVAADTGEAGVLIDEPCATFIDYAHKSYTHYVSNAEEIVWMSERDGWNHLYLFDARNGQLKNQITRGPWVVRGVDRIDDEARQIWFHAGGIYPEQDPYHVHFARVNFDGSGLVLLTTGNGTHDISYSPDRQFVIDTHSRVDQPPIVELRRSSDGGLVMEVERADWSPLLADGWQVPERFVAKGRDGVTDIYGVLYRPTTFDPARKYPVIEAIYAGPQGAFVPKRFSPLHGPQTLAELGFILVQIDGMGTSYRSKAFHDVCWKNLGDSGFPDRILWLRKAAEQYPYLDLSRVGIYGGSAGGQSALRAVLAHGDFYHAAAADCGCHDNRMDKIWWNELWMGWPVGPHYAEQSNVTHADKLRGKLLLTVGELDRNVDPASTMQVVSALVKADKDFELLVVPGGGHGSGESEYGRRRRQDFFVRHLLGVEPRRE